MKIVIVPASALASEDKWTADSYVAEQAQDRQRHASGMKMVQNGLSTITNVAKRKRLARERQRRLGVKELM